MEIKDLADFMIQFVKDSKQKDPKMVGKVNLEAYPPGLGEILEELAKSQGLKVTYILEIG